MKEIERKFLVKSDAYKLQASKYHHIVQAYLSKDPSRSVRIRIKDAMAYITIKGASSASGMSRFEWEKEIPVEEARELMKLALPGRIEKVRYIIPADGDLFFEVDEFLGNHVGLVLAEIELPDEKTNFFKPDWLGDEVTGQKEYYNSYLSGVTHS